MAASYAERPKGASVLVITQNHEPDRCRDVGGTREKRRD